MDVLDRTTQEVLGTHDSKVFTAVKASNGLFSDMLSEMRLERVETRNNWRASAKRELTLLSEFKTLNGHLANLPATRDSAGTLLAPVNKLQSDVSVLAAAMPQITGGLTAVKNGISELVSVIKSKPTPTIDLSNFKDSDVDKTGPAIGPTAPPPSIDYSGIYNDIESQISDLRNSITDSLSGIDLSADLDAGIKELHDALYAMADARAEDDTIDLDGYISDIGNLFRDYTEGMTTEMTAGTAELFTSFLSGFTSTVVDSVHDEVDALQNDLGRLDSSLDQNRPVVSAAYYDNLDDLIGQFHLETIERLDNLDEHFVGGISDLSRSVKRSSSSTGKALSNLGKSGDSDSSLGGLVKAFDDAGDIGDNVSTGSAILGGILDGIKSDIVPLMTGLLSAFSVKEAMETIHKDTTQIIKNTGLQRKEAVALRRSMVSGVFKAYGKGTFLKDDVEAAVDQALRSGAVTQKHLEQATNAVLAYSSLLPDLTLDLSQGWAKQLMVTQRDGEAALENVALSIDTFSNNFYVSASRLEDAVKMYTYSAQIFTNDFKDYSKAMNKMVGLMAAQEDANIQSMDPAEFFNRIAWTNISNLGEADFTRLATEFGISGKELFKMREELRRNDNTSLARINQMMEYRQQKFQGIDAGVQAGGSAAERALEIAGGVWQYAPEQIQQGIIENREGGQTDTYQQSIEEIMADKYGVAGTEEETKAQTASLAEQNQNLDHLEKIEAWLYGSAEGDGIFAKILDKMSGWGWSGAIVGSITGIATSMATKAAGKAIMSKLGGGTFTSTLTSLFSKGGLKAAGGKLLGGIKGLPATFSKIGTKLKGAPGLLGKIGTKLKGVPSFLGKLGTKVKGLPQFFGNLGSKLKGSSGLFSKLGTKLKGLPQFFGKAGDDIAKAGSKAMSKLAPKAAKAAEAGKGLLGKAGSTMGKAVEATKGGMSKAGGALSKAAPTIGKVASKAATVLAFAEGAWDIGAGANKSKEWVGGEDASSKIAAGVGGLLGGSSGEGGFKSAVMGGLKGAGIGAAIGGPVGAAIGAAVGTIGGAIGGEKIAKGLKKLQDNAQAFNDQADVFLEEKLGTFGHAISAAKNTVVDWVKNVGGGLFSGLGSLVKGLGGGVKKIFSGEFKEGFKEIGGGFVNAGKDVFGGFKKAAEDIHDDWTMDAKSRIKKRKDEINALNGTMDQAQDKLDKKQKELDKSVGKANDATVEATNKASTIAQQTGFTGENNDLRRGVRDATGLNPYSYADYSAKAMLENDRPRDLSQVAGAGSYTTAVSTVADSTDANQQMLNNVTGNNFNDAVNENAAGSTPSEVAEIRDRYRKNPSEAVANVERAQAINPNGADSIASPIVSALNMNNSSVVGLLDRIAKAVENSGPTALQQQQAKGEANQPGQFLNGRVPNTFGNKDAMAQNQILNYQGLS